MTTPTTTPTATPTGALNSARSLDGATISYLTVGSGPAALVIPGALSMAAGYHRFASALAKHFTVHIIERRGRGLSSPQGDDYGMRKEVEDVAAIQRQTGAALLVGHSYGGLIALEAARALPAITRVAVYEPGVSIDGSIPMGWMPGYQRKLAEQRRLDAFIEFSLGIGPDRARNTPPWLMKLMLPFFINAHERHTMLGLLPQNLREHQEVARLDSSYQRYREINADVLLMYGGKSGARWVNLAMERLPGVLARSATQAFPKLNHFGIDKQDPAAVAETVSAFFLRA
jgi:pimeloyl-ACP methyl ester carboxylesterase